MESMINLTIEYVKIVNVMLFYRQISDENDYSRAAEPPVRCGESHLSGLTEPPSLSIF